MAHRFFSEANISGDRITLGDTEARHLSQVMRKRAGEQIVVFDGSGCEFLATVIQMDRRSVELAIDERVDVDRELPYGLTLAVALPKGDRQTWMIQKLVELGVTRLVPITTARGVAQPTDKAIERLHRHVIEASKQCGRNVLMEIDLPATISELSDRLASDCLRFVAHVQSEPDQVRAPVKSDACFAVGPEGGFADDEVSQLVSNGWMPIQLGERILRIETAAVAVASWWGISNWLSN